jgi:hypothetical protein
MLENAARVACAISRGPSGPSGSCLGQLLNGGEVDPKRALRIAFRFERDPKVPLKPFLCGGHTLEVMRSLSAALGANRLKTVDTAWSEVLGEVFTFGVDLGNGVWRG